MFVEIFPSFCKLILKNALKPNPQYNYHDCKSHQDAQSNDLLRQWQSLPYILIYKWLCLSVFVISVIF